MGFQGVGGAAGHGLQTVAAVIHVEGRLSGLDDEGDESPSLIRHHEAAVIAPVGAGVPVVTELVVSADVEAEAIGVALENEAGKVVLVTVAVDHRGVGDSIAGDGAIEQGSRAVAAAIEVERLVGDEGIVLELRGVHVG